MFRSSFGNPGELWRKRQEGLGGYDGGIPKVTWWGIGSECVKKGTKHALYSVGACADGTVSSVSFAPCQLDVDEDVFSYLGIVNFQAGLIHE